MKIKSINVFNIYRKSILWGQLDTEILRKEIKYLFDSEYYLFEINLKSIKSMDDLFIANVFVNTLIKFKKGKRSIIFIFSNPTNEEIIFNLDKALLDHSLFSLIKINDVFEIIGNTTFIKKIMLNKISKGEKTNPVILSKLLGKPFDTFDFEFKEFVDFGLLKKESENEYSPTFSF